MTANFLDAAISFRFIQFGVSHSFAIIPLIYDIWSEKGIDKTSKRDQWLFLYVRSICTNNVWIASRHIWYSQDSAVMTIDSRVVIETLHDIEGAIIKNK